ncbi:hypothetical protein, partial [Halobacillus litoralis]|uniref:hypothetical protein n=1 Tax=Halobacillus litoralis TaxID=45668 RepID=UPI001F3E4621
RVWRGAGRPDTYKPGIAVKGTFFTELTGLYREGLLLGTGLQKTHAQAPRSAPTGRDGKSYMAYKHR